MPTEIASHIPGRRVHGYDLLDEITERHNLSDRKAHDAIHAYLEQLIQDDGEDVVILDRRPVDPGLLESNPNDRDVYWWLTISDDAAEAIRGAVEAEHPELWTIDQVAEHFGSQAADPGKSASRTLNRLGVRAREYRAHPESGRPQAVYSALEVREAKQKRPGRGDRTDLRK